MDEKVISIKRPRNITVVSLFYWFNAIALGVIGVVLTLLHSQAPDEMSSIPLIGGLVVGSIALAIFIAIAGSGLWRLKIWAHQAAIVISSLIVIVNLGFFVDGIIKGRLVIPYGIVFHGLVLWVLNSKDVKAVFEPIGIDTYSRTPASEVICPNCGNAVLPTDRFCRKCGNSLK